MTDLDRWLLLPKCDFDDSTPRSDAQDSRIETSLNASSVKGNISTVSVGCSMNGGGYVFSDRVKGDRCTVLYCKFSSDGGWFRDDNRSIGIDGSDDMMLESIIHERGVMDTYLRAFRTNSPIYVGQ